MKRMAIRTLAMFLILVLGFFTPTGIAPRSLAAISNPNSGAVDAGLKLVSSLIGLIVEATPEAAVAAVVEWGAGEILDLIFGGEMSSEEEAYFKKILEEIEKVQDGIQKIQDSVNQQSLIDVLNSYKALGNNKLPSTLYKALLEIDNANQSEEWKRTERLSLLTDSIGAGKDNLANISTPFDNYTQNLRTALLTPYQVTLNGKTEKMMLLQVHYELLRRSCSWEHQAVEEWISFQSHTLGLLVETLTIEKLSLQARLQRIKDYNASVKPPETKIATEGVEEALKDTQQGLLDVKRIYKDENTWMAKPHDENERFYWVPGHEMLFDAHVNTQSIPREYSSNIGFNSSNIQGIALKTKGLIDYAHPVWSFWKPFFRPTPTRLTTIEELKTIYDDYNTKDRQASLYEIFCNEKEGNFQGLTGDEDQNWKMVFDPASHNLEAHAHFGGVLKHKESYTVEAFFLDAKKKGVGAFPKAQKIKLAWYYQTSNEVTSDTAFIGLRRLDINQDEVDYSSVHLTAGMNELPCGWVSVDADLPITLDEETMGVVQGVEVNGSALSAADYQIKDDVVTILKNYMLTLTEGVNTFVVRAENGTMTLIIHVGPKLDAELPDELRTIGAEAFNGIGARSVQIKESCTTIDANAFANCVSLAWVYVPASVTQIGDDAFANCPNLMLICEGGSAAEAYATANGIPFRTRIG